MYNKGGLLEISEESYKENSQRKRSDPSPPAT